VSDSFNHMYGRTWRRARAAYLAAHPLCVMCAAQGQVVAANVVDHVQPHKGEHELFWDQNNWQPLCTPHHNQTKQQEERRGYSNSVDKDGWPTHAQHPSNKVRQSMFMVGMSVRKLFFKMILKFKKIKWRGLKKLPILLSGTGATLQNQIRRNWPDLDHHSQLGARHATR